MGECKEQSQSSSKPCRMRFNVKATAFNTWNVWSIHRKYEKGLFVCRITGQRGAEQEFLVGHYWPKLVQLVLGRQGQAEGVGTTAGASESRTGGCEVCLVWFLMDSFLNSQFPVLSCKEQLEFPVDGCIVFDQLPVAVLQAAQCNSWLRQENTIVN